MTDPYRTSATRLTDCGPARFSGKNPTCRKCRHEHLAGTIDKYDAATDTILRVCTSCSFTWSERAADSGGPTSGDAGKGE